MSTSLLYHGFGIIGYDYVRTDYQDGHIYFTLRQPNASLRCPACGSSKVSPRGSVTRTFRTLPIGSRHTFVILPIPRVACEACNIVRQVHVPFATGPSVIQIRAVDLLAVSLVMIVADVIRRHKKELHQGVLIVIDERNERIRILPIRQE